MPRPSDCEAVLKANDLVADLARETAALMTGRTPACTGSNDPSKSANGSMAVNRNRSANMYWSIR
jgi:hypothetical protein